MYQIDFNKPCHVHFIGIGGISMSGLAKLLLSRSFTVSGSDNKESELTKELVLQGCTVFYSQKATNITDNVDIVIYTAAIHDDNEELMAARNSRAHVLTRAQLLGQVMSNYKTAINVAGTHGKTTTSSMISMIFLEALKDPTISLGGILDSIGGNFRVGNSDVFIAEACEYTNSFLEFNPTVNVILNIEEDHMDFFKDLADIRHSFRLFNERLPQDGTIIINSDIDDIDYLSTRKVITFGLNPDISNYSACDITYNNVGCCTYTLLKNKEKAATVSLSVPGLHNVSNSLAAIACGENYGLPLDIIIKGLSKFSGTHRRFEYKGTLMPNNVTIVDDYAHHPSEISVTLNSAKNYPHNKIWCIFQPHTYTRTKAFFEDFAKALAIADHVILADIYAARETDTLGVSSSMLAEKINELGTNAIYIDSFDKIIDYVKANCINNDLLITMGAGNVVEIGEKLLK